MTKKIFLFLGAVWFAGCGVEEAPEKQHENTKKIGADNAKGKGEVDPTEQILATGTIEITLGVSPMHKIAQEGDVQAAQDYIDDGGDIQLTAPNGNTFLHEAVNHGHIDMVRLLVENGAPINAIAENEWTPLGIAISHDYHDIAAFLIEKGADVNFKNSDGESFLHKASWKGDARIVRMLIVGGIDINAENHRGTTALRIGVQEGPS